MNAYLLGKENMDFGKQVIYGQNGENPNNIEDGEGFDMSDPDAQSHISEPPDLVDLSHIPDESSPADGVFGASISTGDDRSTVKLPCLFRPRHRLSPAKKYPSISERLRGWDG